MISYLISIKISYIISSMKSKFNYRVTKSPAGRRCAGKLSPAHRITRMAIDETIALELARAATALKVSPNDLKDVIGLSHEVFTAATRRNLTNSQLTGSLITVLSMLLRKRDSTDTRATACTHVILKLWAAVELEGSPPFELLASSPKQVH